jgi:hypothetical protein
MGTRKENEKTIAESPWNVKAVKKFRGHDGNGFNANLYHGKIKVAEVDDDGWGGGFRWNTLDKEKYQEFEKFASLMTEPWEWDMEGEMTHGVDTVVEVLVNVVLETKEMKKLCRDKTAFIKKDDPDNLWSIKATYTPEIAKMLRQKHSILEIINERFTA